MSLLMHDKSGCSQVSSSA